ncbi:MAG: carboxyl-terminal processing protease [Clostridia bacterium]|nr:carboxyl-terminal processing protease [Clostridia bacterium]
MGFGVVTHFQEVIKGFKIYSLIQSQALEPKNTDTLIEGALRGMVGSLNDPYSTYLDKETYTSLKESISGGSNYGGVGLLITLDEEKKVPMVVSPFKGAPAQRAGIKTKDFIINIDGQSTNNMDLETAANLMKGEPGTKVELTILSENDLSTRQVVLTREIIQVPAVEGKILEGHQDIGYLNFLTMFSEQTAVDLGNELKELRQQGMKRLIIDLRNNPGGSLAAAVDVASYFVPEGPIVYLSNSKKTEALMARGYAQPLPLVVLVNGGSASASEIVAGAIKDTKSGYLVGEKTFGKGIVQTIYPLPGDTAVRITTHKYLTPGKHDIHHKGIMPDYVVTMEPEIEQHVLANAPDVENDPQLQKAIELLENQ